CWRTLPSGRLRMSNRRILATAAALAAACVVAGLESSARAVINIDGTKDAAYGTSLSLQTNNTGFGDNTLTDGNFANGSELDAAYGKVENGYLNLMLTGNFETNFNHLNIFIADNRAGQSTLQVAN